MTEKTRAWVTAGLASALGIGAVVLRIVLYDENIVYDQYPLTLLTIAAISVVAVAAVLLYRAWRIQRGPSPVSHSDMAAVGTALAALATGLYALAQITLPTTPQSVAASACRGAPLHGATAYGQTTSLGVNARSGAGTAYPLRDRFGSDCSLGFDGFCVGEPVADPASPTSLPDQRWLIIHDRNELISAAYVRLQRPITDLGGSPSRRCPEFHGLAVPSHLTWQAHAVGPIAVKLTAVSQGSILYGFAVEYSPAQASTGYPFIQVGDYSPTYSFVSKYPYALWKLIKTPPVQAAAATLIAVGTACLADDAPVPKTARFKVLTFSKGVLDAARDVTTVPNFEALTREACSIV